MGIPQITDRMRSAPLQALRTMFTGIGRIVMTAERPQPPVSTAGQAVDGRHDRQSARSRQRARDAARPAESRWRSLDETGNVRLLSADDFDEDDAAGPGPSAADLTAPDLTAPDLTAPDLTAAVAQPPADSPGTEPAAEHSLPLAGYDTLTLASIRARLRTLDPDQLRVLVGYEQSHAERPEVLGMLERRIEKLETGG